MRQKRDTEPIGGDGVGGVWVVKDGDASDSWWPNLFSEQELFPYF